MTLKQRNILAIIVCILFIWLMIMLPFICSHKESINPDLQRLDAISKELTINIANQKEIEIQIDNLKQTLSWLQTQEVNLNNEAEEIFMRMIKPTINSGSLIEDGEWKLIWWIWREPWQLNESWDTQVMPPVTWDDSHERFKSLATSYGLNPSTIREVENHYWIKEGVILCITVAETSWWNRWAGWKNIWSVWSNDRGDRPTYALMEAGLEAIWKTLNNQYLWKHQTLWCLSNAGHCNENLSSRYATSDWNRERNMVACLSEIYWKIDPATFNIRR